MQFTPKTVITRVDRLNGQNRSYTVYTVDTERRQHGFARRVERVQQRLGDGEAQDRWAGNEILGRCLPPPCLPPNIKAKGPLD